jgi:hypothetical protein
MTTLQKTAVMIGLAAFVFVVVCPLTVTPTAVTKSAVPLVILIVMPMLAAPVISAGALPECWRRNAASTPSAPVSAEPRPRGLAGPNLKQRVHHEKCCNRGGHPRRPS